MFLAKIILLMISVVVMMSSCATIDRGNFGQFKRSLNVKNYGHSVIEDPTGIAPTEYVELFEVRPGDCWYDQGWDDCKNDRERSELTQWSKTTRPGHVYWYGWYVYFPNDYPNIYPTKVAVGQFHQHGSHPVWMFQNANGGYHLDDQVTGTTRRYYKLIDEEDLRGKWHKIELHVKWAKDQAGFFKAWVNGERKINYQGRTMGDAQSVYFKYGVYRSFMSRYKNRFGKEKAPAQRVYFANVKRGNSRDDIQPPISQY